MSKHEKDGHSSIDTILKNLTERPNVELTLILSRKDGSVIKTAGSLQLRNVDELSQLLGIALGKRITRAVPYQPSNPSTGPATTSEDSTQNENGTSGDTAVLATPAEELARGIFQFLKAAGAMGGTLEHVCSDSPADNSELAKKTSGAGATTTSSADSEKNDSSVQLLRLRVKQREIIIFPDPQYLCCVVQKIGK